MTKEERMLVIDWIIRDILNNHEQEPEELEDILKHGAEGYINFTDKELREEYLNRAEHNPLRINL